MPKSTPRKDRRQGELLRPSNESGRILELLKTQAQTFRYEPEESELQRWLRDLNRYPMQAIEWAFENWRTNGHFFPVPADIILLLDAWEPSAPKYLPGCDALCNRRHGKGYNSNDVLWLWQHYNAIKDGFGNRKMTDLEIDTLFGELDKKRGSAPEWRQ